MIGKLFANESIHRPTGLYSKFIQQLELETFSQTYHFWGKKIPVIGNKLNINVSWTHPSGANIMHTPVVWRKASAYFWFLLTFGPAQFILILFLSLEIIHWTHSLLLWMASCEYLLRLYNLLSLHSLNSVYAQISCILHWKGLLGYFQFAPENFYCNHKEPDNSLTHSPQFYFILYCILWNTYDL